MEQGVGWNSVRDFPSPQPICPQEAVAFLATHSPVTDLDAWAEATRAAQSQWGLAGVGIRRGDEISAVALVCGAEAIPTGHPLCVSGLDKHTVGLAFISNGEGQSSTRQDEEQNPTQEAATVEPRIGALDTDRSLTRHLWASLHTRSAVPYQGGCPYPLVSKELCLILIKNLLPRASGIEAQGAPHEWEASQFSPYTMWLKRFGFDKVVGVRGRYRLDFRKIVYHPAQSRHWTTVMGIAPRTAVATSSVYESM